MIIVSSPSSALPSGRRRAPACHLPPSLQLAACRSAAERWAKLWPVPACAIAQGRGPDPFMRHLGFYLAHVACGLAVREVARVGGCHPSSVAYAIRRIERARDDRRFDAQVDHLEGLVRGLDGELRQ